jgi:hypothetical protein
VKTREPKKHNGQWNVRSTGGAVRWITKINDTTYWFEGRSAAIRNGYSGNQTTGDRWKINFVDFDGGPTVKVGSSLHSYGVEGSDQFRIIKSVRMAAVPAAELLASEWVRVEVVTD